jgi:hypothetical protein
MLGYSSGIGTEKYRKKKLEIKKHKVRSLRGSGIMENISVNRLLLCMAFP